MQTPNFTMEQVNTMETITENFGILHEQMMEHLDDETSLPNPILYRAWWNRNGLPMFPLDGEWLIDLDTSNPSLSDRWAMCSYSAYYSVNGCKNGPIPMGNDLDDYYTLEYNIGELVERVKSHHDPKHPVESVGFRLDDDKGEVILAGWVDKEMASILSYVMEAIEKLSREEFFMALNEIISDIGEYRNRIIPKIECFPV